MHRTRPSFRHPTFLKIVLLASFVVTLCGTPTTSVAVPMPGVLAPNVVVKGDISEVTALGRSLPEQRCSDTYCSKSFAPLYLSIVGPSGVNLQVQFTSASFPRNVVRIVHGVEVDDRVSRPVLLKGVGRIRHASSGGGTAYNVPVAATLFRDSSGHYISVTTRRGSVRRDKAALSLLSVRIPLVSSSLGAPIASRASQVSSRAFTHLRCATNGSSNEAFNALPTTRTSVAKSPPSTAAADLNVIFIATDFDTQYANKVSCSTAACNNKILSAVNGAAVFYQQQLGITFTVKLQFGPNSSLGTTTVSKTLLDNFTNLNNISRSAAAVDLYQLYTGRTLNQNVIGLAFVGVTCSNKAFADMLVQRVSDSIDPLTIAHEAGHTFNATHPASSEGGIMDATLGANPPSSFSTRSLGQMRPFIDANYARCIGGTSTAPTATPTANATATPTPGPGTPTATPAPGETPTETPSATPTPRRGSGGNSGSDIPRTIVLRSSLGSKGLFKVSATISEAKGCIVSVSAGGSEVAADPGTTFLEFVPATTSFTYTADMPFRVKASKSGAEIFFFAKRTCLGVVTEVSKISGVRPSRVAAKLRPKQQKQFPLISKRTWITNLSSRIVRQDG